MREANELSKKGCQWIDSSVYNELKSDTPNSEKEKNADKENWG